MTIARPLVRGIARPMARPLLKGVGVPAWVLAGAALDFDFAEEVAWNSLGSAASTPTDALTYTAPSPKMVYGVDGVLRYAPHNLLTYSSGTIANLASVSNIADAAPFAAWLTNSIAYGDNSVTRTGYKTYSFVADVSYRFSAYIKMDDGGAPTSSDFSFYVAGNLPGFTTELIGDGVYLVASPIYTAAASGTAVNGFRKDAGHTGRGFKVSGYQLQLAPVHGITYVPTTSAASYSIPLDHDPITFDPLGVLIEEQRTNLLTYSEQFDNAVWTKGAVTVTANAVAAPDGTVTGDKLIATSAVTSHVIHQNFTTTTGLTYTQSIYLKKADWSEYLRFSLVDGASVVISLVTSVPTIVSGSVVITDIGDGWYRLSFTAIEDAGASAQIDRIVFRKTDGTESFAGDDTSGVYLWGAQLEAGAFPTSYIPTVASQVTRAADRISIAQSGYAFNANAGTFVAEYDLIGYVANYRVVSGGSAYRYFYGPGTVTTLSSYNGSATITTTVVSPVGNAIKVAMSYDGNGRSITDSGDAISGLMTDANAFLTASTTTAIGTDPDGSVPLNGHIKRLTYFPTRKSNSELQALTA